MLKLSTADLKNLKADTLLIPACEDKALHSDPTIKAIIKTASQLPEFSGKKDEEVLFSAETTGTSFKFWQNKNDIVSFTLKRMKSPK